MGGPDGRGDGVRKGDGAQMVVWADRFSGREREVDFRVSGMDFAESRRREVRMEEDWRRDAEVEGRRGTEK